MRTPLVVVFGSFAILLASAHEAAAWPHRFIGQKLIQSVDATAIFKDGTKVPVKIKYFVWASVQLSEYWRTFLGRKVDLNCTISDTKSGAFRQITVNDYSVVDFPSGGSPFSSSPMAVTSAYYNDNPSLPPGPWVKLSYVGSHTNCNHWWLNDDKSSTDWIENRLYLNNGKKAFIQKDIPIAQAIVVQMSKRGYWQVRSDKIRETTHDDHKKPIN